MQLPQMYFQPEDNHETRTVEIEELEKKEINGALRGVWHVGENSLE